jgi:hypothetical protein
MRCNLGTDSALRLFMEVAKYRLVLRGIRGLASFSSFVPYGIKVEEISCVSQKVPCSG